MEKIAAFVNGWTEAGVKPTEDAVRAFLESLSPDEYRTLNLLLDLTDVIVGR